MSVDPQVRPRPGGRTQPGRVAGTLAAACVAVFVAQVANALPDLPPVLRPRKGRFGLVDQGKAFCPDPAANVFVERGIDPAGCLVLARPDQHVAAVLPLDAVDELTALLDGVLRAVCGHLRPSPRVDAVPPPQPA